MNQRPQESIWGTINTCIEIALNIYAIVATDENGREHTGVMARKNAADTTLSEKATALADQKGDWLYFNEDTKDVAMYEILEKRIQQCKQIEAAILAEMEEIRQGNQIQLPEYFKEYPVPAVPEDCQVESIRNGMFKITNGEEVQFAIHNAIAERYLSPMAMGFGAQSGEYWNYNLEQCAIPMYELMPIFAEVNELVISPDSLHATLHEKFADYVNSYHRLLSDEQLIPDTQAPVDLFLGLQLSDAQENEEQDSVSEPYGEEVDYGFER